MDSAWFKAFLVGAGGVLVWTFTTGWAISARDAQVSAQNDAVQKDISMIKDDVEALTKRQDENHDQIIRFEVRQGTIIEGISEIKDLIKDKNQ